MAHNHFAGARLLTKCEKRDGVRELRNEGGEGGWRGVTPRLNIPAIRWLCLGEHRHWRHFFPLMTTCHLTRARKQKLYWKKTNGLTNQETNLMFQTASPWFLFRLFRVSSFGMSGWFWDARRAGAGIGSAATQSSVGRPGKRPLSAPFPNFRATLGQKMGSVRCPAQLGRLRRRKRRCCLLQLAAAAESHQLLHTMNILQCNL